MEEFIKDKTLVAESEEPTVSAWINDVDKESILLDNLTGFNLKIIHTTDPEFSEDELTVRLTGKPKLGKGEEIKSGIIGALAPFLETKVDRDAVLTVKNMPYRMMTMPKIDEVNSHYGEEVRADFLAEDNAVIMRVGNKGSTAILASSEPIQGQRGIFVFTNYTYALYALQAFQAFPPFKNNTFYLKAKPMMIKELDLSGMQDERFIFFDVWQKAVANLSAHLLKPEEKEEVHKESMAEFEERKQGLADTAAEFVAKLREDMDAKKVYASRIEKPLTHGCTGCAFKHPDLEGPSDFCAPFHNFCRTTSKVEDKDVEKAYIYIVKKNSKYKESEDATKKT